jgi:hypothetical protein
LPPPPEKKTLTTKKPPPDTPFPVKNVSEKVEEKENKVDLGGQTNPTKINPEGFEPMAAEKEKDPVSDVRPNNPADNFDQTPPVESTLPEPGIINLDQMPVKLEPIDSSELEHINDKWLDPAYERILLKEGDNLKRIKNAEKIVQDLLGNNEISEAAHGNGSNPIQNNVSPSPTSPPQNNKALKIVSEMTQVEEIDETIPDLPENPSQEELWKYAQNHPSVKKALRIFRGKLVKVTRNE